MLTWLADAMAVPPVGQPVEDLDAAMPRGAEEDAIPAIDDPTVSDGAHLDAGDRVLGLTVDGQAVAYPIRILDYHEIVNHRIGEVPVAVTFCPLCGAGVAFDRRVDDQTLTFAVSGRLYRNDLVMVDRETGSLWPQILGEALHGPLEGTRLDRLDLASTTWRAWRRAHPETQALEPPEIHPRATYASRSHPGYEETEEALFERTVTDDRLHPKRRVIGLARDGDAVALPLETLEAGARPTVPLAGTEVELTLEDGLVEIDPADGRPVRQLQCFWFAWVEFHPDTRLVDG